MGKNNEINERGVWRGYDVLNCLTENVVSLLSQSVEAENLLNTPHKTSGSKQPIKQP